MAITPRSGFRLFRVALSLLLHFIWLMLTIIFLGPDMQRGFIIRQRFCRKALSILGIKVNFVSGSFQKSALYISNHRSMLDPLIELAFLNTYILSKSDVAHYPIMGAGARRTGVVFVDRNDPDSRKAALRTIEKLLRSEKPVLIYPEGTTYGGPLTGEFRRGGFEVAFQNNIPVLPVMIDYPDASYYWTEGSLLEYFNRIFSMPGVHQVRLNIGEPITANTAEELMKKTKEKIDFLISQNSIQSSVNFKI